jgi:hypothetical protein
VRKSIEQSAIDVNGLISSNSPSISDLSRRNYSPKKIISEIISEIISSA